MREILSSPFLGEGQEASGRQEDSMSFIQDFNALSLYS